MDGRRARVHPRWLRTSGTRLSLVPGHQARTIASWPSTVSHPLCRRVLAERTANARRSGCPRAVYDVVDLVWKRVENGPRPAPRALSLRSAARLPLKASTQLSRVFDKLEQELRGVTDAELARLAMWCVNQIETETELKRIAESLNQRIKI